MDTNVIAGEKRLLDEQALLTDSELAGVLRVSRSTVSRAARDGRIPLVPVYVLGRSGRRWRSSDVAAYVAGQAL